MEPKLSESRRPRSDAASDSDSDPEREFSGDDDDDDRNHKHRRREIRSQSLEFEASLSVSSRPFNKRKKPFDNGQPFRNNDSQSNEGWNSNNYTSSERETFLKTDRRHFDSSILSMAQVDANRRNGLGQIYHGDSGFARGRGRESWNPNGPRYAPMGFPPVAHQGSVSSNLFAGRGLPNVAGVHKSPWNPYGVLAGLPNGGLDAMHSLGVNPILRPPIYPPNIGITRQKCRDFEERGFCLRGDMCPMEHGVNRIVVDDVQSLSKFNLPGSLSAGNTIGVGGGSGPLAVVTDSTTFSSDNNNNMLQSKMGRSKPVKKGINNNASSNMDFPSSATAVNDFYDPDQPLLNKDAPHSADALSQPCSQEITPVEPVFDPSIGTSVEVHDGSGIHPLSRNELSDVGTRNFTSSALGSSMRDFKSRSDLKGKGNMMPNLSGHNDNSKGSSHNSEKPLHKAMRTIFVNGIPQKDNNKEALRSHFQKFGEIIDIYIPSNSEKAFVQFSTRDEAEAALKAPDAVMGNRFIKLWWANRDRIPDTGFVNGNNTYTSPHIGIAYSGPTHSSISSKGRIHQLPPSKASAAYTPSTTSEINVVPVPDQGKQVFTNVPALAPSHKKLENLEELKEQLRKKQELLDQKRNEFKRKLDMLEKQTAGVKGESAAKQPTKRNKVVTATDVATRLAPQSADISTSITFPKAEELPGKTKPLEEPLVFDPDSASTLPSRDTTSLEILNLPSSTDGNVIMNRCKLDDSPKAFKIVPPLPSELADVATLKEHFSPFGEVNDVELVNVDTDECGAAIITFKSHHSAEKAFQSAKSWKGHDLLFIWVTSNCPGKEDCEKKKDSSSAKEPMDVDTSLQNHDFQDAVLRPVGDSPIETHFTEKIASPDEKMLEIQLSKDDANKSDETQPLKDAAESEKHLSEGEGYIGIGKTSSDEETEKTLGEQSSDDDAERANEKPSQEDNNDVEEAWEDNVDWKLDEPEQHLSYGGFESRDAEQSIPIGQEDQLSGNDVL